MKCFRETGAAQCSCCGLRIRSVLTDHDSGHSQQQRGNEGRSPDRQTQSQVGERWLGRQEGHLYETGGNNIVPHLLTSPVEVFTFTLPF